MSSDTKSCVQPKRFQLVLSKLVRSFPARPYARLCHATRQVIDWSTLPTSLDPGCIIAKGPKAQRKRWQVESLVGACAAVITPRRDCLASQLRIVDFCGGSGHVGLVLACVFSQARVIIVDMKLDSLEKARARASEAGLTNVEFQLLDIRLFASPFDIGCALHACGEASDLMMQKCIAAQAAFVCAPCCVGKLRSSSMNPSTFNGTGTDKSVLEYPRSQQFRAVVDQIDFDHLARAADFADAKDASIGVLRRAAKSMVELDRALLAEECGYATYIFRMQPAEASAKNEVLVGLPPCQKIHEQVTYVDDPIVTESYLLINNQDDATVELAANDWSASAIESVRIKLDEFVKDPLRTSLQFSSGTGAKERKLVHHMANLRGLTHRTVGKKNSEKYVVVSIKRGSGEAVPSEDAPATCDSTVCPEN